jgi:polyisoprenoid-binding protein YceI
MTSKTGLRNSAPTRLAGSPRKHHWGRRILTGIVVLVVLVVGIVMYVMSRPSQAALALPRSAASAPAGPLDGTWNVTAGSAAGFRLSETAFGVSKDVVGRTSAVTGTIVISGGQVTRATLRTDLTTIRFGKKPQPQFGKSLGTGQNPDATFTLGKPVTLSPAFASGKTITVTANGQLAMHGISRPATFTITGRRDGSALQVAGTIPVTLAGWSIKAPANYGPIASLANHGTAEFLLILHQK